MEVPLLSVRGLNSARAKCLFLLKWNLLRSSGNTPISGVSRVSTKVSPLLRKLSSTSFKTLRRETLDPPTIPLSPEGSKPFRQSFTFHPFSKKEKKHNDSEFSRLNQIPKLYCNNFSCNAAPQFSAIFKIQKLNEPILSVKGIRVSLGLAGIGIGLDFGSLHFKIVAVYLKKSSCCDYCRFKACRDY